MKGTFLLVEHEAGQANTLATHLRAHGHVVDCLTNMPGKNVSLDTEYDAILLFVATGQALQPLKYFKELNPKAEVIICPNEPKVEEAVDSIKNGAFYYLSSLQSLEKIEALMQQALTRRVLSIEVEELREALRVGQGPRIIGESPAILEIKKAINRVAVLDCTVLIRGETGTGKELVARAIHRASQRGDKNLLAVNCSALSEELLANELFGHEKGAYTGATKVAKGVFEACQGGTILLDEIGDTTLSLQTQLLRVLQEKTIMRVGGIKEVPLDVRILAATNRSLRDDVEKGLFREDLYYRLNVFLLRMPPLRERRDDIPLFVRHFLDKYTKQFNKSVEYVSDEVMRLFMSYPFPGNVRELEHAIERAIVLCDTKIVTPEHLPKRIAVRKGRSQDAAQEWPTLAELERSYIHDVLAMTKGNKSQAARVLGIDRSSLWRRLKELP